jgi:hypothetical protein
MFEEESWYRYLDEPLRDLVDTSFYLLDREMIRSEDLHDYSFVVFPMAKAYEGFLKKFLFDIGLITRKQFLGKHFRIGKSLNPALPEKYHNDSWLVDDLNRFCGSTINGEDLDKKIWKTWQLCRNRLFHFFPGHTEFVDLNQAEERINMIKDTMVACLECQMAK